MIFNCHKRQIFLLWGVASPLITSLLATIAIAETLVDLKHFPLYQNGSLQIPRVDTLDQIGLYQDALLQFDPGKNAWNLLSYRIAPPKMELDVTEVIITDSFPTQVFLRVLDRNSICSQRIGQVYQRLIENRFVISIDIVNTFTNDPLTDCVPYEEIIALSTYGLNEGGYEFVVNNGIIGNFILNNDNRLR
ncbi:hypothetical protein [Nitrosomonas sp. PY1]|uniref:hypothetical protein n=1 Tax=Nitrosomonas sp. PY1 TaxID=1803906 RepID=UPI001FC868F0|nr:hypothetical protein [Nitrosomonas sp. PY1]